MGGMDGGWVVASCVGRYREVGCGYVGADSSGF
jgi:hypothetical protein